MLLNEEIKRFGAWVNARQMKQTAGASLAAKAAARDALGSFAVIDALRPAGGDRLAEVPGTLERLTENAHGLVRVPASA